VECTPKLRPANQTTSVIRGCMRKTKDGRRRISREFKIAAVRRVKKGEKPSVVARSLNIQIELLSRWCRQVRAGGEEALKEVGRPKGMHARATAANGEASRVAQLERLVGKQQAAIDFLAQALRRVEELRHGKKDNGATASSK